GFSTFANLQGGSAVDTFTLTGPATFNVKGGAGLDVVALQANVLTGSIAGETAGVSITGLVDAQIGAKSATTTGYDGTSAGVSGGFTDALNLSGSGTLTGTNSASAWSSLTGTTGSYSDGVTSSVGFSTFANLQGGSAVDTFTLTGPATFNVKGGAGLDVVALQANVLTGSIAGETAGVSITGLVDAQIGAKSATTTGYDGTSASVSGGFTDALNLSGSGTLTGTNSASAWSSLTGTTGSYSDGGTSSVGFSTFANLQGGSAVDTFTLTGPATFNVKGGAGLDVVALQANVLTGSIAGETAGVSITGLVDAQIGAASSTTTGYDGTSASVSSGFTDALNLSGSGTLTGTTNASTWSSLTGSYTDNSGTNNVGFSTFANLQGGTAVDTFTLTGGATFNLKGGAGLDVVALGGNTLTGSIAGETAGVSITGLGSAQIGAASATTTGYDGTSASVSGGFTDALNLSGSGTLTGTNNVSAWSALTGTTGSYTDNSGTNNVGFSTFANLQGGTAVDTFTLTGGATFNLKGGAGLDVVALGGNTLTGSIAGETAGVSITGLGSAQIGAASATTTGYDGTSASVSGGFTDALNLSGSGTLTGTNNVSAWSALTGTTGSYTDNSGTNNVGFSTFANLQGGTAVDTFTLTGGATFNLKGGAGLDVVALGGNTLTGSIAGETAGVSITGLGSAQIGAASATTTGYDGTSASVSGGFTDALNLSGSGTLTGTNNVSAWSALTGTTGSYTDNSGTNNVGFSTFANLQGGTAVDTFTLTGGATFNLKGGAGLDVVALGGNTLTGSIAGETAGVSITGLGSAQIGAASATTTGYDGTSASVSGGFTDALNLSGSGTLTGTNNVSAWSALTGTTGSYTDNSGTNNVGFSTFANLQGGTAVDTFTLTGGATFNLKGGAGLDVVALGGNTLTGSIAGETAGVS